MGMTIIMLASGEGDGATTGISCCGGTVMKRKIYDQEKLQRWADDERGTFIFAGALSLSEAAQVAAASQQQDEKSAVSKIATSRRPSSKVVSAAK